jgi:UDP-N-acetylmuramate dehydrogenase
VTLIENVPLAPYTTLGVGGPARWFAETAIEAEVLAGVRFARAQRVPWFILGGGSNLLVSDDGFPGVVVRIASGSPELVAASNVPAQISAPAGADWDSVVSLAIDHNFGGIECLAGIPGSVGGTPVQNVGAYGQEVSHSIASVRAIDLAAEKLVHLTPAECGFAYRRSIFNTTHRGRYAITRVTYALRPNAPPQLEYRDVKQFFAERGLTHPTLADTAAAVRAIRARKGMVLDRAPGAKPDPDSRSAGSFFKNPIVPLASLPHLAALTHTAVDEVPQYPSGLVSSPANPMVKLSAAWLLERAGFHKGFALGRAGLSTKHVLAIVNRGDATASEIVALRDTILREVHARFAIQLEQEPVPLGFSPV